MKTTVEKLLKIDDNKELKLLAGTKGVKNVINSINIMDNPESTEWIMPGDLVITTGFFFKGSQLLQKNIIKELAESNCSALALKPRKYFGSMPETLIEAANDYNLPLLEISIDSSLSQVSNKVSRILIEQQESIVRKTLYIHEQLTEINLSGGGVSEITKEIVSVIENPLIVVSSDWRLIALQDHEQNPYILKDSIPLEKNQSLFQEQFKEGIPNDARDFKKSIKRKLSTGRKEIICRIVPIKAVEEIIGYIIVWETVSKMTKLDYIAIEKAAVNIAIELMKTKEVNEVKNKIKYNFFDDLLQNKMEKSNNFYHLAGLYGMSMDREYICITIRIDGFADYPFDSNEEVMQKKRQLTLATQTILNESKKIEKQNQTRVVHVERGREIVMFYPLKSTVSIKEADQLTRQFSEKLYANVNKKIEQLDLSIGISGTPYFLKDLNKSFQEAQKTLTLNKKINDKYPISHYNDYLIHDLLSLTENKNKLEKYYRYTLSNLENYDNENKTDMLYTLETYFNCQGNIEQASKQLFIHRNTLVYRLNKIMDLLNVDLKNAKESFELQVGFVVKKVLNTFE